MSNIASNLAQRRNSVIRHYDAGSPEAVEADRAWRRARIIDVIDSCYGDHP